MYVLRQVTDMPAVKRVEGTLEAVGKEEEQKARYETLVKLLDRNRICYHIDHKEGKRANHLSHYLVAQYGLGATPDQLEESFEGYVKRVQLVPAIPSQGRVTIDNWMQFLGKKSAYMDLVEFYMKELSERGIDNTIQEYVPYLLEGVGSQAFHGLIQLGYGLEVLYPPTIAEGLAYWTYCFTSLGQLGKTEHLLRNTTDAFRILGAVKEDSSLNADTNLDQVEGFLERQTYILQHYGDVMQQYDIAEFDLNEEESDRDVDYIHLFGLLTLQLFVSNGCRDFFLLHGVTSMRALQKVLQHVSVATTRLQALRFFWKALLYTYVAEGRPDVSESSTPPPSQEEDQSYDMPQQVNENDWLLKKSMEANDAHLSKVEFVCAMGAQEDPQHAALYMEAARATVTSFFSNGNSWSFRARKDRPPSKTERQQK